MQASKIGTVSHLSHTYARLRLPEPVAGCDVVTIITCNCNPMHTSALMVRVYYGSHQSVYLYNTMMSDNI